MARDAFFSAPYAVARVWSFSLASRLPSRAWKTPKKKKSACAGVQLVHAPLIQSILSNKGLLSAVVKCIFFSAVYFNLLTCFFVFVATTVVAAFVVGFALGPLIYPNVIQKQYRKIPLISLWFIADFVRGFKRAYLNTGRPESQQPTGSQIIRICMKIYLKIDKMVKMYKNSY